MLHHLSFAVADLTRAATFYDAALAPLGYARAFTQESGAGCKESAVGYARPGADDQFAIRLRRQGVVAPSEGFHLAFRAHSQEAAIAFHQAALAHADKTTVAWAFILSMVPTISRLSLLIPTATGSKLLSMMRPNQAIEPTANRPYAWIVVHMNTTRNSRGGSWSSRYIYDATEQVDVSPHSTVRFCRHDSRCFDACDAFS